MLCSIPTMAQESYYRCGKDDLSVEVDCDAILSHSFEHSPNTIDTKHFSCVLTFKTKLLNFCETFG